MYCTGYYLDDLDLDPTIGIDQHVTIDAAEDFFVLQIKQCEPSVSNLVESACDFYIAPDQETLLTNSGVYEFIIPSASGCDSVITLHLTITESSASNFSVTACDQYTSPEGSTWTTTGVYQEILLNAAGCDSIITYHLTIEESSVHVVEASGCNSYTTPDGLFTWTVSGIYQVVVINQTECDSIISYNITIHTDQQSTVELTACDSYTTPDGMNSWSVSGVYTYTLFSSTGCDSTITLHLTIEASDVSVIQTDSTLQAVQNNAGYQWIDCANGDAAIPGETSQTFSPSVNGNYAVVVNHNGCIDTSACYAMMILGTDIDPDRPRIRIFPNPAEDHFYIHFGRPYRDVTIEIKNMDGKILSAFSVDDLQMFHIEHALPSGMYFISIKLDGYHFVEKLSIP